MGSGRERGADRVGFGLSGSKGDYYGEDQKGSEKERGIGRRGGRGVARRAVGSIHGRWHAGISTIHDNLEWQDMEGMNKGGNDALSDERNRAGRRTLEWQE